MTNRVSRVVLSSMCSLLVASASVARERNVPMPCQGRYVAEGDGLVAPGASLPMGDVVLSGDGVQIDGWCTLAKARTREYRNGRLKLRASFNRCGPLAAGRLTAVMTRLCDAVTGTVNLHAAKTRWRFRSLRPAPREDPSTFGAIEQRIFGARGCATSTCHGADATSGLDLRKGVGYDQLVGVPARNAAAKAAGRLRVVAGDPGASFLSAKLHGTLGTDEGARMPLGRDALAQAEIDLVDAWIAAGAPRTGVVENAPPPPPSPGYRETEPLAPPPGGFQLYLEGPVLQPGEEQEGCLWVPSPNATDVPIKKIEVALNPGTHHFAVWVHAAGQPVPETGVWRANDVACLSSGASLGQSIAGAPGAPYFVSETPPGIAGRLPGGTYFGLNAHYYNEFDVPIQIKVWTNFYPYEGTPEHYTKGITSLDTTAGIRVAPFTQATRRGRFVNQGTKSMFVLGVGGHMHKRGVRFSIWQSDGTKVLDDFDWAHPSYKGYWPPYELRPGDWFDYECLHDNGVTRPVRLDAAGNPTTLVFGISAEDEMCILTGGYYDD